MMMWFWHRCLSFLEIYIFCYFFVSDCSFACRILVLVWYWVQKIFDYQQYYTNTSTLVLVFHHNTPRIAHPCKQQVLFILHLDSLSATLSVTLSEPCFQLDFESSHRFVSLLLVETESEVLENVQQQSLINIRKQAGAELCLNSTKLGYSEREELFKLKHFFV